MRVALYDPTLSGHHPEYAANIVRYLSNIGDDVLYITPDQSNRATIVKNAGAKILFVGRPSVGNAIQSFHRTVSNVRSGLEIAREWNADIFHHLFVDTREPAITTALSTTSTPILFTLFNPHYHREGAIRQRVYGNFCFKFIDIFSLKSSFMGMFVHTPQIKERIHQRSQFLEEKDLHVVPDPVALPDHRLSKEEARRNLNIKGEDPIYLFFGGLRAEKGAKLLMEVIGNLDRDATFVIAGSEGVIGQTEIEVANNQSRAVIDARLDFIPDSKVYTYFFACDAVVLPYLSEYSGTSGVLQRSAAAGRPVIATNVGEVGPLVKEYDLGYVVQSDVQSITRKLKTFDPQTALKKFESALLTYAEKHSVDRFSREIRSVYSDVTHE
ncbi:glycosyltransferase family 4 protein [Haladaptatus sp. CMSO5]|uniref:glycosyltransferase family 4 protein n=1 Tax=Haladaptatus sp. CMSO5 TaxID=3120514 RepID=UPI002FCE58F1